MFLMPFSFNASMIRLKPSVSSSSGPAALRAASAMVSLQKFSFLLVEIVGVLGDVVGKAERVLTNECFGPRRVAGFDRFNDVQVIVDRTVGAVLLHDGLAADHPHMCEEIFSQPNER